MSPICHNLFVAGAVTARYPGDVNKVLALFVLLAACSPGGSKQGTEQAGSAPGASPPAGGPAALGSLTGLYEGGAAGQPNQLCIIERKGGTTHFGLVVWGANLHSCSGTGTATLSGNKLRLAMAGDSECAITASVSGTTITLPASVAQGCAYYCGARASLDGASFVRKGSTRADALKASDLVGESLCNRR